MPRPRPPSSGRYLTLVLALAAAAPAAAEVALPEIDRDWISLRSVAFDTRGPAPELPADLRLPADDGRPEGIYLVKFPGPIREVDRASLESAARRVYAYLPHDAFLVRLDRASVSAVAAGTGASWIGPWHPAYKLAPEISALQPDDPRSQLIVMLRVYPDADLGALVQEVRALGMNVVGSGPAERFARVRILTTPAELVERRHVLARMADVFFLDIEPRKALLNDTTIWVGQSGVSGGQATPIFAQGLYGEGQVVGIIDTGIDADMCWFYDSARGLPPRNECNGGTTIDALQRKVLAVDFLWSSECSGGIGNTEWDTHDHGSHVAGTVAGDQGTPLLHDGSDGMAPGAKLVIQDCGFQTNPCADCPGIGCPVVDMNPIFQQAYDQGARIHTNSYGDNEDSPVQNNYTATSEDVDQFMWNHKDFLIFFAAGNSGPGNDTVGSPSTAKSAVSVGATLRGSSAESMASFSSCGYTDDLRYKPEITVPGSSIVSANNDGNVTTGNCGTTPMSGTSMASPGAAGLTALVREYYTDGFYPSGVRTPADAFAPSAALMRATLVNSAQNMTGAGSIPARCQGWGRVLLDNALSFSGETRKIFATEDAGFPTGSTSSKSFPIQVLSGSSPFKATLAWTDYPSTPAASPHLNNDLDLVVTAPDGTTTYRGNVFSGGQSTTGGSLDRRNTLEQVLLLAPTQTGTYTVTVQAVNVPNGTQPFALVVTGHLPLPAAHATVTGRTLQESCLVGGVGSGNAIVEPGEDVIMPVTIQNDGNQALTGITGLLSTTTPGVTITDASASWPNLALGASGSTVAPHFAYTVGTSVPCGTVIAFTIAFSSGQGSWSQGLTVPVGAVTSGTLLSETFGASIPGTWTIVNGGSGGGAAATWVAGNDTTPCTSSPNLGAPFAARWPIIDSDCASSGATQDEQLVSPSVNATGCSSLSLSFTNQFRWYNLGNAEVADVDVSTNGGASWANVLRMQGADDGYPTPNTKLVDLGSAAGQPDVKVRFRYSNGTNEWWWAVDNVQISCGGTVCNGCAVSPPGEVPSLSFAPGSKTTLQWPATGNSAWYDVHRGTRADLPALLNGTVDSCRRFTGTGLSTGPILTETPAAGTLYWYLVTASNGGGRGSAGNATAGPRVLDSSGACP